MTESVFNNVHSNAKPIIWSLARKIYADTRSVAAATWIGRGWDDKSSEHATGLALDVIFGPKVGLNLNLAQYAEYKLDGDAICAWLVEHAEELHIRHIIFNERIYRVRYKAWGPLPGRDASSNNSDWHRDHVHIWLEDADGSIPDGPIFGTPAPAPTPAPVPKPTAPASPRVLRRGVVGDDVKRLQAGLLRVFPAYARSIRTNGGPNRIFGPATEAVVKEFQRRSVLKVDGIVGPDTRASLARYGIKP